MNDDSRHRWERRQIDAAIAKIEEFRDLCAPAAERYERLAAFWGRLHVSLGLPAAVLAAGAGVAALADFSTTVSGVVALSAAALSAATTFLGVPIDSAQRKPERTRCVSLQLKPTTI